MAKKKNFDEEKIIDMYLNKKISSNKIAKEFGCCSITILRLLERNKINRFTNGFFNNGKIPWNKGLTIADPRVRKNVSSEKAIACRFKKGHKSDRKGKTLVQYLGKEKAKRSIKKANDTKKKLFKEGKLKAWNTGMKGYSIHTDESKKLISEAIKGSKHTKKTRKKISKTKLRKFASGEFDEVRKKISKGRIKYFEDNPEARAIIRKSRKKQILPIKDTSIEIKIQNFLKKLGIEFFTHQYMKISHGYQCDILIPSMNMVIECDGDYWHKYPVGNDLDHIRTSELLKKGFKVLRLWEFEIKKMSISEFQNRLNSPNFPLSPNNRENLKIKKQ